MLKVPIYRHKRKCAKILLLNSVLRTHKHYTYDDLFFPSFCWYCLIQFCGVFHLDAQLHDGSEAIKISNSLENGLASIGDQVDSTLNHYSSKSSGVIYLEFSLTLRLLFVLFSDGQLILCSVSKKGFRQADSVKAEKRLGSGDAVCVSVASDQQILAVGTTRGVVELYDLAESVSPLRSVSLYDWG